MLLRWSHLFCSSVLHGIEYIFPEGWKAEGHVDFIPTAGFEPSPLPGHKEFTAWSGCFFYLVEEKWVRRRTSVFVFVGHVLSGETEAGRGDVTCLKLFSGLELSRVKGCPCSRFT